MAKGFRPGFKEKLQEKRVMNEFKAITEKLYENAYIKLTQENYTMLIGDNRAISMINDSITIENAVMYLKSVDKEIVFPVHFVKKNQELETIVDAIKKEMDESFTESDTSELYCINAKFNQLTDKYEIELIHIKHDNGKLENIRRLIRKCIPNDNKFNEYERQVDENVRREARQEFFMELMIKGISHTVEKGKRKEGDLQS